MLGTQPGTQEGFAKASANTDRTVQQGYLVQPKIQRCGFIFYAHKNPRNDSVNNSKRPSQKQALTAKTESWLAGETAATVSQSGPLDVRPATQETIQKVLSCLNALLMSSLFAHHLVLLCLSRQKTRLLFLLQDCIANGKYMSPLYSPICYSSSPTCPSFT